MLQQPRVPATGQRQAIEIHIKWREVLAQKRIMLKILSRHTGHSMRKLDAVCLPFVIWTFGSSGIQGIYVPGSEDIVSLEKAQGQSER